MGRIGYLTDDDEAAEEIYQITQLEGFSVKGLFSHMATADEADKTFSYFQEQRYREFAEKLKMRQIEIPIKTLANSASIMELPTAYFDAVRPGIILYGCYPSAEVDKNELSIKPVMSIKANIVHIKNVPKGFSCSYGRKFITERPSVIGTVGIGYADGYPRPYSQFAKVIVNGQFAPIAGNICMDQCMIDWPRGTRSSPRPSGGRWRGSRTPCWI